MSLSEQTARVAGGGKNTLKIMLQKLGVGVGSERIDQYPTLASQISGKLHPDNLISAATASSLGLAGTATPNEAFAKIKALIDAANANANTKCRVVTGSYVGTNTYGESAISSLKFPFKPQILIFPLCKTIADGSFVPGFGGTDYSNPMISIDPLPTAAFSPKSSVLSRSCYVKYDPATNTMYWFSPDSAINQLNSKNYQYYWIAIG